MMMMLLAGNDGSHGPHPLPLHLGRRHVCQVSFFLFIVVVIIIAFVIIIIVFVILIIKFIITFQWEPRQNRPILGFENSRLRQRCQLSGLIIANSIFALIIVIIIIIIINSIISSNIIVMFIKTLTRLLSLGTLVDLRLPLVVSTLQVISISSIIILLFIIIIIVICFASSMFSM